QPKPKSRNNFRKPLTTTRANRGRVLPELQLEHEMRCPYAGDAADYLCGHVDSRRGPGQRAAQREGEAHGRIEVRTGKGSEHQDEYGENGPRRQRVAKERERAVIARELLRHDS